MTILGIDIGGSGIKCAPVDLATGKLTADRRKIPTPQPSTPKAVAGVIDSLVTHFNWTGPIGCGIPSVIRDGIALTAANIDPQWIGTDVKSLLRGVCRGPVAVINDADAAGLAEVRYGAGQNFMGTMILITIGTGLGTALFRDGTLLPNTELGHIMLNNMVAEKYASAASRKTEGLSYREWAGRIDLYLHRLEELLWPDLFIIGGGASNRFDKIEPFLTVETKVVKADFQNDAGIVGAALAVDILG